MIPVPEQVPGVGEGDPIVLAGEGSTEPLLKGEAALLRSTHSLEWHKITQNYTHVNYLLKKDIQY